MKTGGEKGKFNIRSVPALAAAGWRKLKSFISALSPFCRFLAVFTLFALFLLLLALIMGRVLSSALALCQLLLCLLAYAIYARGSLEFQYKFHFISLGGVLVLFAFYLMVFPAGAKREAPAELILENEYELPGESPEPPEKTAAPAKPFESAHGFDLAFVMEGSSSSVYYILDTDEKTVVMFETGTRIIHTGSYIGELEEGINIEYSSGRHVGMTYTMKGSTASVVVTDPVEYWEDVGAYHYEYRAASLASAETAYEIMLLS